MRNSAPRGRSTVKGIAVAAHAHSDEGVAAAVRAGVRTIEHATYASDDTLRLMKAHHTYLVSTVSVLVEYEAIRPGVASRVREMVPRARDIARRALNIGVDLVQARGRTIPPPSCGYHWRFANWSRPECRR